MTKAIQTVTAVLIAAFLVTACGLEDWSYDRSKHSSSMMAITSSNGDSHLLRSGSSLNIATTKELNLKANTPYTVVVTNLNTGTELSRSELLSDMVGVLEIATVAHDLGEFDDVEEMDTLSVKVTHPGSGILVEDDVPVAPDLPMFEAHGFQVDEIQPPHIFSADSTGTPQNGFVVGGAPEGDEVGAPIYVAGKNFPPSVEMVDLYIVKDADVWKNTRMPLPTDEHYVVGPVVGQLQNGVLPPTALPWQPEGKDVGIYDILVDVDRNGTYDYGFSAKDGSDGEGKVGFTIQYGAAWQRAKLLMQSKHLLVNLAYTSKNRKDGTWSNSYSRDENIYSYVNPPVQKGERHGYVQKLLIVHQNWSEFWNNPEMMIQGGPGAGRIDIQPYTFQGTGGTPQVGCTNSPPVKMVNPNAVPMEGQISQKFDVVFDYGKDGYYDVGVDFLDVVSTRTDGALVTAKDLEGMPDDQIYGLEIK
jgi:hypothetical protein